MFYYFSCFCLWSMLGFRLVGRAPQVEHVGGFSLTNKLLLHDKTQNKYILYASTVNEKTHVLTSKKKLSDELAQRSTGSFAGNGSATDRGATVTAGLASTNVRPQPWHRREWPLSRCPRAETRGREGPRWRAVER